MKQHKSLFEEKCLVFLDQRKQANMQRLQVPNQSNVNNVRCVSSRHFRKKEKGIHES